MKKRCSDPATPVKSIDPAADGWFDVEDHPVLTQARSARLSAARAGFDMGIPFNDLNRAFDLGFGPLPWGDQGYVPSSMKPADEGNPRPEGRSPNSAPSNCPNIRAQAGRKN